MCKTRIALNRKIKKYYATLLWRSNRIKTNFHTKSSGANVSCAHSDSVKIQGESSYRNTDKIFKTYF